MIDQNFLDKLNEIVTLLDEAYDHWMEFSDDHHSKSSEGYVEIRLPTYWARRDDAASYHRQSVGVGIYSYVLGPSRMHDFDNIDDALTEVKKWHAAEMADDYKCEHGNKPMSCDLCWDWLK